MEISHLTPAEEQLMQLFWKLNSFYLKEVMEQHPEPKPHQNTISTYLKILVEKKFLKTEKEGRIFRYTVIVPKEDYRNFLLRDFIGTYFENSAAELIKTLLAEKIMSANELSQFFEVKAMVVPVQDEPKKESSLAEFIEELTEIRPSKKEKKKNKKDKKKKK